ncbi:MAG: hypothetical protein J5I93_14285, partial [Pirellulaceae bacterium]|nr:hypothetical protein [Pirellulaceae bacterium]
SQLDSHALARSGVSEKPNDPPGKPAGFSSAGRDVCSEKPNDPTGKPAGFEAQNSLTGAHRERRALNTEDLTTYKLHDPETRRKPEVIDSILVACLRRKAPWTVTGNLR